MDPRAECLRRLRNCPALQNLKLIHQGIEYEIEKLLLSSVSPVFCRMLIDNPNVSEIQIPSVPGNLREFIDLLYGGNVRIHADNCRFLYFLASFFDVSSLKEAAAKVVRETNFMFEMIPFIESLVANNLPCQDLIAQIAQNVHICKDSPFFKNASFELVSMIADHPDAADYRDEFLKAVKSRDPNLCEDESVKMALDPKPELKPVRKPGDCGTS